MTVTQGDPVNAAVRPRSRRTVSLALAAALVAPVPIAISGAAAPAFAAADPAPSLSSTPDRTMVTNGPVHSVVRAGDTVYIGGRFDRIGPRTGPGVEVGLDGTQVPGLPEVAGAGPTSSNGSGGHVSAVVPDGSGGWYIGGLFTHVGTTPRSNLAHIRADRTVDPTFAPAVNDAVKAMALSGTTLFIAGPFTTVGGQTRNRVAAIDVASGAVTAFNPNADGPVYSIVLSGDGARLYAAGRFTTIGGLPRLSLAALDTSTGSAAPTFSPNPTGTSGGGAIDALAISGSTLYVGGTFNSIGGLSRTNLAAVSLGAPADGVGIASFDATPSRSGCAACGSVAALAVSGSTLFAGGMFDTIGGQRRVQLAGLDAITGTATAFDPSPNGNIRSLVVSGSTLYVGGSFRSLDGAPSIGGQPRNYAAGLRIADGVATAFNPDTNGLVMAVGVGGSAVYLGGYFSSLRGVIRTSLAALDADDGSISAFNPKILGVSGGIPAVYSLAVAGSTIYAGGFFGHVGGQPRTSLAAMDAVDGSVRSLAAPVQNGTGAGVVQTVAVSGDVLYVGGAFNTLGGQPRTSLGAVSTVDGTTTAWNPNPNSEVDVIRVVGDLVYVGGFFTRIGGGLTRNKVAALSASDGTATSWDPDATALGNVLALAVSGSTVYLGGNFTTIKGVPRKNIAAVSAVDGVPTAFDPTATDPTSGGGVHALAVRGDTVYAAGFFSSLGGQTRHLIGGVDAVTGSATDFDPHGAPGFGAFSLDLAPDGTLYAGGSFLTLDKAYQQAFAQFTPEGGPTPVVPEGSPWVLLLAAIGLSAAGLAVRHRRRPLAAVAR